MTRMYSQAFENSSQAWEFMRRLDAAKIETGFPGLKYPFQVAYKAAPAAAVHAEVLAANVRDCWTWTETLVDRDRRERLTEARYAATNSPESE